MSVQSPTVGVAGQSRCLPSASNPCGRAAGPLGSVDDMSAPLEIAACRRLCSWEETGRMRDGERLFACSGCGSEWVASEPWTPIDHTGVIPPAVQAERRRGRG